MCVTLELLNKFIKQLVSCTQGLNKFVGLLAVLHASAEQIC